MVKEKYMNTSIEEAIKIAKTPKPQYCGECNEEMFSPMAKMSIALFGKCEIHLDEVQEKNLFTLVENGL